MSSLADACARGAMAQLTSLYLHGNQIGDAGVQSLATASASGALGTGGGQDPIAKGPLWLLGADALEIAKDVEANWVAPVFEQIVTEAKFSITPEPKVLVLYADANGQLVEDIKAAFSNAGIVVPDHLSSAKVQDVAI